LHKDKQCSYSESILGDKKEGEIASSDTISGLVMMERNLSLLNDIYKMLQEPEAPKQIS